MLDPWVYWAIIGVVCIGLEMLLPGFVIFFFGMGGIATALLSLIPFVSQWLWLQVLIFIVTSLLSLIFFRRHFKRIFSGTVFNPSKKNPEEVGAGETAEVLETVGPVQEGRIRFQGTTWSAQSSSGTIPAGSSARIVDRKGLVYIVEPINSEITQEGEKNARSSGIYCYCSFCNYPVQNCRCGSRAGKLYRGTAR
ncbi:NfeD family protein [Brucepastera parasyntrophica]|uniref:NfeD family protein n=1 Tax=Brucepastera parasyntrophica TaxID=2880008 RepID=UPI00210D93D6|nr:NfeD family protein [Brucepastera parasyntrophica]ULQ58461.1 NfeD family protein [Brucepastera parasyntrophica]